MNCRVWTLAVLLAACASEPPSVTPDDTCADGACAGDASADGGSDASADAAGDVSHPDAGQPDAASPDVAAPTCTTDGECADAVPGAHPVCQQARCTDGACTLIDVTNGTACLAASACHGGGICAGGTCVLQAPTDCDDGEACTTDDCDDATGCTHAPSAGPCDDGDPCTNDACADGACVSEDKCDDADPCTEDSCTFGVCGHTVVATCADGNPCTTDLCTPDGCDHVLNTAPCDDGDLCTINDLCADGLCVAGPALACDDENPCTDDACDPQTGLCQLQKNAAPCDDGSPCTSEDTCVDGLCTGVKLACDDDDPCTADSCSKGKCVFTACNDGDACTTDGCTITLGDFGPEGKCTFKGAGCNDGDPCTFDACNPEYATEDGPGCLFTFVGFTCKCTSHQDCEDGNPCTADGCLYGVCEHFNKQCGDGSAATFDYCDPTVPGKPGPVIPGSPWLAGEDIDNCKHVVTDPTGAGLCVKDIECDSGSECIADTCVGGKCQHQSVVCDDGNDQTNDSCNAWFGCQHELVKPCSKDAECNDKNACTEDLCDKASGFCINPPLNCYDDPSQDPLAVCTADWCDAFDIDGDGKTGCMHELNDGCAACVTGVPKAGVKLCDDANACTVDVCRVQDKVCVHTTIGCDDGNACTTDVCYPDTGCTHAFSQDPCNDFDNCTLVDKCVDGACVGTKKVDCDDKDECTEDFCDPWSTCKNVPDEAACDDGDPCTLDLCDKGKGCTLVAFDGPCDDGDPCTEDTVCDGGICAGSPVPACTPDEDGDGVPTAEDNCPAAKNPDQTDTDGDGAGDACDPDADGDLVPNSQDNCPLVSNPDQEDANLDGIGDACYPDTDGDGVHDDTDNCTEVPNPLQHDTDLDGVGDLCDDDLDGDSVPNELDLCPYVVDPAQADFDGDGAGDACDGDDDGDGAPDGLDCKPKDPTVSPNLPEVCNDKDDDCDGLVDEGGSLGCLLVAPDVDQDGWGSEDPDKWLCACEPPPETTDQVGDCDDNNPFVNAGQPEACGNFVDDDCDGQVDEADCQ